MGPLASSVDITTIVIDLGSGMIKAGFAGEDAPRWMFSSVVGSIEDVEKMDLVKHKHVTKDYYVGDAVWPLHDVLKIRRVIKGGVVQNWQDFELLLSLLFFEEMKLKPEELVNYPVMCSEEPLIAKVCLLADLY